MSTSENPEMIPSRSLKPGINRLKGHVYIQGEPGKPVIESGMTLIAEGNITIGGDVEAGTKNDDEHAIIESLSGEVTVNGTVGNCASIRAKRNIEAEEVLPGSEIMSGEGNILIDRKIGNACRVFAHHGKIVCPDVGDNVIIEQMRDPEMNGADVHRM